MSYPTTVQLIKTKRSQQWYVNFPSALANAMDFSKGEVVEWTVVDRGQLMLERPNAPAVKKRSRKVK
jgi:hypothetical protein